jgi:serine/threonine-protein kinase SRPK3
VGGFSALRISPTDRTLAQWVGHGFTHLIQKQQYRCPEVILGAEWSTSADIWSVACVASFFLFLPGYYTCSLLSTQIFELITDEYLFHPASGSLFSVDDDHIAQIMELMGDIPQSIKSSGKHSSEFFNGEGKSISASRAVAAI